MIEFIYEYWSLIVIMFLAMMSPSPDFILVIKNGQYGFKSGLATSLGITLGFTIHTCFVIFGFSYIITQNPDPSIPTTDENGSGLDLGMGLFYNWLTWRNC